VAVLDDPHVGVSDQLPHLLEGRNRGGRGSGKKYGGGKKGTRERGREQGRKGALAYRARASDAGVERIDADEGRGLGQAVPLANGHPWGEVKTTGESGCLVLLHAPLPSRSPYVPMFSKKLATSTGMAEPPT